MTVRLRPHHLLCMLTYAGKGYSAAFTAGYDAIAARLAAGEDILIVEGPDDICAPLLTEAEPHCRNDGVMLRDRIAARDVGALLAVPVDAGAAFCLDPASLATLRERFAEGGIRAACSGCEWAGLCSTIAANGYGAARVRLTATPCAGGPRV